MFESHQTEKLTSFEYIVLLLCFQFCPNSNFSLVQFTWTITQICFKGGAFFIIKRVNIHTQVHTLIVTHIQAIQCEHTLAESMYHLPAIIMFFLSLIFQYKKTFITEQNTTDNTDMEHRYNITTIHSWYTCIHKDVQLLVGLPKCNFLPLVLFIFGHQRCVCFFSPIRGCGLLVN